MNRYTELRYAENRGFASGAFVVVALFMMAAGSIAWVCMGIVANDRWPIRWLELHGAFQRVSAEQLRAGMTPLIDDSFFSLNLLQQTGLIALSLMLIIALFWLSELKSRYPLLPSNRTSIFLYLGCNCFVASILPLTPK